MALLEWLVGDLVQRWSCCFYCGCGLRETPSNLLDYTTKLEEVRGVGGFAKKTMGVRFNLA
jgi:hypothetical protein